jgi:propanol-preferring alcohol dehydrogenase
LDLGAEEFQDFQEVKDVAAEIKRIADGIGAHGVIVTAWQSYKDMDLYTDRRQSLIMLSHRCC